ncbi:MAG: beta-N-acetylhexosaminidase [Melioribacteraceae bacterium]|nr:MAG: beta-N-acetylhexosaminidase [Melioribacteraceae bacterium]
MVKLKIWFAVFLIVLLSGGISFSDSHPPAEGSLFEISENSRMAIENILANMTLEEKCGQLIVPYAYAKNSDENSRDLKRLIELIDKFHIGGIMFLSGDIENQAAISNKLQSMSNIPLLVAADYERGIGMRLEDGVEFPFNMAVAAANDTRLTYLMGKITGIQGRAIGVHQNYAPIVDINHDPRNPIINTRAFSDDQEVISTQAIAYVQGLHEGGMISTAKHFPGHGATDLDSHKDLPIIRLSENEFYMNDLVPFRKLINFDVKSVMVGHLDVPAYEYREGIPATLSENVVTNLLKRDLGFKGLVVTDALNMHAVTENYEPEEIAVEAIKAGNDLLLFPADEEKTFNGLLAAVRGGIVPESRIDESVRKMLTAKSWLGLLKGESVYIDTARMYNILHKPEHYRLAEELAEKSITLLRDDKNILPLEPLDYYETVVINLLDHRSKWDVKEKLSFEEKLSEHFGYIKSHYLNLRSKKRDFNRALSAAMDADIVFLPVYVNVKSFSGEITLNEKYKELVDEITKLNKPVIVVSIGNPYIISDIPNIPFYMCTYGNAKISQYAAANALVGKIPLNGVLPVSILDAGYFIGDGFAKNSAGLWFQSVDADSNYDFSKVESLMNQAVKDKVFPGATLLVGHRNRVVFHKAFGHYTYDKESPEVTTNSIFDLASVSKVVGTTTAAMLLYQDGLLELDYPVKYYLPEFAQNGKQNITIRHLLSHSSGLPAFRPFHSMGTDSAGIIEFIMNARPEFTPGTEFIYSDLGMITMQKVIEQITGSPLDQFLQERVFDPLKMRKTFYNPPIEYKADCVPTENDDYFRHRQLQGTVHDETTHILGGVAGHAGIFSTTEDLAKLIYLYVNNGKAGKQQFFRKDVIDTFTSLQNEFSTRALGWDKKSPDGYSSAGSIFPVTAFGHTGYTGTSVWIDRDKGLFVILLTNRVQPTRENRKISRFRPIIHDAIFNATTYFPDEN